jgi:hypothetical protein
MQNCLFAWPDRLLDSASYSTVLSGGSWNTDFPLANLKSTLLSKKARSADALAASTKFDSDLGTARAVRVIALLRHNAGSAATVRVRAYSDSGYTTLVHDAGTVSFWPEGYPAAEDKKRYQEDFYIVLSSTQTARYWRTEIVDTANPAGYFEMGRCIFAPAYQPAINMIYGANIGLTTDTSSDRSLGGVDYFDRREPRRVQQFTLNSLDEAEAFNNVFDMQWDRGIDRELLFVHDPGDTGIMLKRRAFLSTLRQLSAIEYPYGDVHSVGFEVGEVF